MTIDRGEKMTEKLCLAAGEWTLEGLRWAIRDMCELRLLVLS